MNLANGLVLSIAVFLGARATAQDVVSMDEEPHYTRVFANDKCRVYLISLGRLEQTKPVAYEHDFARIPLTGTVEQAWDSAPFSMKGYDASYYVLFSYPVERVTLRNPRNEPYREVIVEILKHDTTQPQFDPGIGWYYPNRASLGPGVDPHVSYVTSLANTSVEIMNVQLLSGESRPRPADTGVLLVAMTDLDLVFEPKDGSRREFHLAPGDVRWLAHAAGSFQNGGKQTARFAIFGMQ